jgi:hypothetical protein
MTSKGGTNSLRVMTYNIRYDNVEDGENQWPHRKANVASLIRTRAPDIFGVQEALARQMNDLQTALPNYRYYGVGRKMEKLRVNILQYFIVLIVLIYLKMVRFGYRKHRLRLEVKDGMQIQYVSVVGYKFVINELN